MTRDTGIGLFLMGELIAAQRANDPDAFRGLLSEGIQELGVTEVEELLLDWLYSFLTAEEQYRLTGLVGIERDEPEFELALGGKDGARFEIDGVVRRVEPHMVNVRIGRLISFRSVCGPSEDGLSHCVRLEEDWKTK